MAHTPRKRFGQNFLQDHNVIAQIIGSIQINSNQHWVEIGPGQGALTQHLLAHDIQLDLIELDRDLVSFLNKKFSAANNLSIHSADALRFDFSCLITTKPLHVIGNLPYNISTPLLFHLLEYAEYISAMYFMLQKEVVDRICAAPGSKKYGRLSVMIQYLCDTEYLFDVAPESFFPVPKVKSAVVRLNPYQVPPIIADNINHLNKVVLQAFSQRRKTLRNSLKDMINETQMQQLDIDPAIRAESLTLNQFVKLSNLYSKGFQESSNI